MLLSAVVVVVVALLFVASTAVLFGLSVRIKTMTSNSFPFPNHNVILLHYLKHIRIYVQINHPSSKESSITVFKRVIFV